MVVTFDLYLFTEQYILALKNISEKQSKKKKGDKGQEGIEDKIGTIYSRNSPRETPIFFNNLEELIGLLEAGYAVGATKEPKKEQLGVSEMPDDGSIPLTIEMKNNEPMSGTFVEPDGQADRFDSTEQLRAKILKHIAPATS